MQISNSQLISLIDLTSLGKDDTAEDIDLLAGMGVSPCGKVAAVCVYPQFIDTARKSLDRHGGETIPIATVVNFPHGEALQETVLNDTQAALELGAAEIDMVFPYKAFIAGEERVAEQLITAVKALCVVHKAKLKVILETGALESVEQIRRACEIAADNGADFLKTSTGKSKIGATPEAVSVMADVVSSYAQVGKTVGIKVSGGVREIEEAQTYLEIIAAKMGDEWINPEHVRIGTSALLKNLMSNIGIQSASEDNDSY